MNPSYAIYICPVDGCGFWADQAGFCQEEQDHPRCKLVRVIPNQVILDEAKKLLEAYPHSEGMFGAIGKAAGVTELVERLTGLKLNSDGVPCDQDAAEHG